MLFKFYRGIYTKSFKSLPLWPIRNEYNNMGSKNFKSPLHSDDSYLKTVINYNKKKTREKKT